MKRNHLFICLLLLLVVTVIPAIASPVIISISPATAPNNGDVTVTITGTGFNAESTVWMNSYNAPENLYGTIVSWSPTSITCTFPLNGQTPAQYNLWVNSPFTAHGTYFSQDVSVIYDGLTIYRGTHRDCDDRNYSGNHDSNPGTRRWQYFCIIISLQSKSLSR